MTYSPKPLMGIWPNSTGMIPGWSLTKIVKMVMIGKKRGSQNAIFKNLFVQNCKAYITSSGHHKHC